MFRRVCLTVLVLGLMTSVPASAQLVVIDPANLVQAVLISLRAQQAYDQLRAEYQVLVQMAQGLGHLDGYRIPAIAITYHDPGRWAYGRPWIQGLNSGDARGTGYLATTVPLQPPDSRLAALPAAARRVFESAYASVEIADSVAMLGGHQVALTRDYHDRLQQTVQTLEDDVLNRSPNYHQMTAVLDKIAAAELLARRQDMAANQLLSHALEQLLARSKRERDTEATTINMQLTTWREGRAANDALAVGTGDALRTWRQP
jgi:hypothetical protein